MIFQTFTFALLLAISAVSAQGVVVTVTVQQTKTVCPYTCVPDPSYVFGATVIPSSDPVGKPGPSYANSSASSLEPLSTTIGSTGSVTTSIPTNTTEPTEEPLLSPVATPQGTPFSQPYFACANGGQGVPDGGANQACTFAIYGSLAQDKTRASCYGKNSAIIRQGGACFGQERYEETCSCLQDDFNLRDEVVASRKAAAAAAATPTPSSRRTLSPIPTPSPTLTPTPAPAAPPAKKVGKEENKI